MSEATLIEPTAELAKFAESKGLRDIDPLLAAFAPAYQAARTTVDSVANLTVTDATQLTEMRAAREARLVLVKARTGADAIRKREKEVYKKAAENVDALGFAIIRDICEPAEARLKEMEEFAARAEAKRKSELIAARRGALSPFVLDVTIYPLGDMTDAAWAQLLEGSRAAWQAKVDADAKVERDRLAKIEDDRLEGIRIREENARLAREREEVERAAKAERDKAAAELAAANAKASAEAKAAKDAADAVLAAERKKLAELARNIEQAEAIARANREREAAEARKAAAAPDAEKIKGLAAQIRTLGVTLSPDAAETQTAIDQQINKFAAWLDTKAAQLAGGGA